MSRLQLLITQYREDESIIKNMLDSIQSQINIDLLKDIEVIIGNDGSDIKLTETFLKQYTFPIQYHFFSHSRIAGCRKHLYNISSSEYIMYCDGDDMFLSNIALSLIFNEMDKPFDCLNCDFYRELKNRDGSIFYKKFTNCDNEIHGLVFRRQFLEDNKIEWHEELHECQSGSYVGLAKILAKEKRVLKTPIYLWKYYPDAISWKDGNKHIQYVYSHYIDMYDSLITDLKERGIGRFARYYMLLCLYDAYYQLMNNRWYEEWSEQHRINVYSRLAKLYRKHQLLILKTDDKIVDEVAHVKKQEFANIKRDVVSLPPIEIWLQNILYLFRGI